MSLLNAVWMALLLTLCIHNYWSMESTSGMITLINCAARGMERTKWVKYKVILGFAILVAPLAFVNQIYLLHQSFPIDGWNSFHLNARSVYALREIPQWCSIAGYLALRILSIIAETILCAWGVLAISMRVRNSLVSLFLCAIVFGTAVVLATLMGYPPILSGRVQAYDAFMVMAVFLVTFVALCLNYSERKNFQRGKFEYT